jgi:hypothetical protein
VVETDRPLQRKEGHECEGHTDGPASGSSARRNESRPGCCPYPFCAPAESHRFRSGRSRRLDACGVPDARVGWFRSFRANLPPELPVAPRPTNKNSAWGGWSRPPSADPLAYAVREVSVDLSLSSRCRLRLVAAGRYALPEGA